MKPRGAPAAVQAAGLALCGLLLAAPGVPGPARAATSTPPVAEAHEEWWVELSLPAVADVEAPLRAQQLARVRQQQADVSREITALGGRVTGRVQRLRNVIAVRIPPARLDEVRRLPGVKALRPVRHHQQPDGPH